MATFANKPKPDAVEIYLVRQIQLRHADGPNKGELYWAQPGDKVTLAAIEAGELVHSNRAAYVEAGQVPEEAIAEAVRYSDERELVHIEKQEAAAERQAKLEAHRAARKPKGAK